MTLQEILDMPMEILKYLSIPLIAGLIGWFTNWVAIKMTFYPLTFWGKKIGFLKLGWQGIIPANASKISNKSVDLITEKLLSLEEIFGNLDSKKVAEAMAPKVVTITTHIIDNTMVYHFGAVWKNIPKSIKSNIYEASAKDLPATIDNIMLSIKTNLSYYIDIKKMCVDAILKDVRLLNDIFIRCGKEEFKFIVNSGWWFGLIFGIFQMIVWYFFPKDWTLPVCGIIVGYATNWLALKLIFEPKKPKKIFGYTIQGLFIKRQADVSLEYAKIVSDYILNSEQMWEHMLNDNGGEKLWNLFEKNIEEAVERQSINIEPVVNLLVGSKKYEDIKTTIIKQLVAEMPRTLHTIHEVSNASFNIEKVMGDKMTALTPEEFEGVLRPAFQEEELTLILVGAVLGGVAGLIQLMLVFGGGN